MGSDVRFGRRALLPVVFIGVTLLMLRPNPARLDDRIPGNTGDPALITWTLEWGTHALAPGTHGSFFDANIYWPNRETLTYADTLAPLVPPYAAFRAAGASWQAAIVLLELALAVFCLWTTYALGRWLTGRRDAAVLGALAFTFSGYALAQWGHVQLQTIGLLPLGLLLLFRLLEEANLRLGVPLGLVTVALALSSPYYALIWAVTMIVVVVAHAVRARGRMALRTVTGLAIGAAITAGLVWPEAHLRLQQADQGFRRSLMPEFGLKAADFARPGFGSYLWGSLERALPFGDEAHRFFPGSLVALLALAGAAAALWPRRRAELSASGVRLAALLTLVVCGVVAALLAAGPVGPASGAYRALYDHVPGFDVARVTSRFAVVAVLAIAMLATVGFAAVAAHLPRHRARLAALVAGAVILAELAVPLPWAALRHDKETLAVYRALSHRPAGAVVELPIQAPNHDPFAWALVEAPRMVYSSIDWHPRLNGYSGFIPPDYPGDVELLNQFPHEDAVARCRLRGVRYVVLHLGRRGKYRMLSDDAAALRLRHIPKGATAERFGNAWLVDLGAFFPRRPVVIGRG